ncbi:betaine-aldehyde dehydrogenase [Mycolicibacterium setense]|nr:betaine-aldehyde dehydrogenase [Mycolicibacterium setense]
MRAEFNRWVPGFITPEPKGLFIDGRWVEASGDEVLDSFDPSTGRLLGRVALATERDVDIAVASARRALEGPWGGFTPAERQDVLLRLADLVDNEFDELCRMDSLDMGQPAMFSGFMRPILANTFRYAAAQAVSIHGETLPNSRDGYFLTYTLKEPVGVVGAIIPWNGPIFNATWKIAPVLASGCTLVLKCAEQAAYSPMRMGELCVEAGVPPGVVNVITGRGAVAGHALAMHPGVDKISFTGSTTTGRKIVEASGGNFKRLTMEMGGKSPDIVFADADLDLAVQGAGMGVFGNSGQTCCAGTRLYVERPIYDEFVERLVSFANNLRIGDALRPDTQIGPLVTKAQLDRVVGYLKAGLSEGASLVAGGHRLTTNGLQEGYFVPPTVFRDVTQNMRIAREEIFGPVLSVMPFDDEGDVIKYANDTNYGLGSGIWTNNLGRAHRMASQIKAGVVWINCYNAADPAVPFGGYKMSGYGKESGPHHISEYLNTKAVWVNAN